MDDPSTQVTEGFGLMFYQSRFYDPQVGRFVQADTVVPGDIQGLDRYAYVLNNPIVYTDPSGHAQYRSDYQNQIHARKLKEAWIEDILASAVQIGFVVEVPSEDCDNGVDGAIRSDRDGKCYNGKMGMGTVVGDMGTIVTAYHTLLDALDYGNISYIWVKNAAGKIVYIPWNEVTTTRVSNGDQVILHLDNPLSDGFVKPATQASGYTPKIGDAVNIVYVDSQGYFHVMTTVILNISRQGTYGSYYVVVLNVDGTLNYGDSGGGVFYGGRFIGITNSMGTQGISTWFARFQLYWPPIRDLVPPFPPLM
jgi:RHS repeat-associated protein